MQQCPQRHRYGWASGLARFSLITLTFEIVTGLAIFFSPFHPTMQWSVLAHTLVGALTLLPLAWYCAVHWMEYRRFALSHIVLLGYVALVGLAICAFSGVVITWQGLLGIRTSGVWRQVHLWSTWVTLGGLVPHLVLVWFKARQTDQASPARGWLGQTLGWTAAGLIVTALMPVIYSGTQYHNQFPEDYSYLYGTNRPFAPSLARTDTGGAFDSRSLAGSQSCGTAGCHEQILAEWQPSAHRYAAMDSVFLGIQNVMAKENGAESTRYCGGCHDPISLFSGTKNIFVENLTGLHGYQEGVSCLACHAIRETDVQGNANYTVTQPREYLWQWQTNGPARLARDFLIRTYPAEHNKLSKRMFKKPEYCAACHKQFIDQEVNRVGWVQLQNQYDNWAASHWRHEDDPTKTIECRECHMPLVTSSDPAAGDPTDYNRHPTDGRHRSHRFLASNQLLPQMLSLEGWEEQVRLTRAWLEGKIDIPEIQDKWPSGPIVKMVLEAPTHVTPGQAIPLRVVLGSNKVGHDFPTGPLDIIQSWLEIHVTDQHNREVFTSGVRDEKNFLQPGTFLFKAEPVDQYGNLIDRHNLWEMVGVRYRRALFPGYSDTVDYLIQCPSSLKRETDPSATSQTNDNKNLQVPAPEEPGTYLISVALQYRKIDQFLLNYLFGEDSGITAPVSEIVRASTQVQVEPAAAGAATGRGDNAPPAARIAGTPARPLAAGELPHDPFPRRRRTAVTRALLPAVVATPPGSDALEKTARLAEAPTEVPSDQLPTKPATDQ